MGIVERKPQEFESLRFKRSLTGRSSEKSLMGKRTDVMKILDNQKLPVTQAVLFLFRSGGIFIRVNIKSYTWFAKKKKKTILKRTWKL